MIEKRFRTDVSVHDCPAEKFEAIAEKYNLEVKSTDSEETIWATLKIPEANTNITWFKE